MARWIRQLSLMALGTIAAFAASAQAPDAEPAGDLDGPALVGQLAKRCRPWISQPGPNLKSLKYAYHLGNDQRNVELVAGVSRVRRGAWQGTTLFTGLHALITTPDRFEVAAKRIEGDAADDDSSILLTARPKNADEPIRLEAGNGIDGSWRGYFSQSSPEMQIELDADTLLPLREIHDGAQFEFGEWRKVGGDQWAPQQVVVRRGDAVYRMHFAWVEDAAWLLTHAEIESPDGAKLIARVSDIKVNNQAIIAAQTAEQRREQQARDIVRDMLRKNAGWLAPKPSFDSLQYTFHTERQDVKEQCVVRRDGFAAFEVAHDGKGEMTDRLGDRLVALADGRTAVVGRGSQRALIHQDASDRRGPNHAHQLRRYSLIGCQFDLPLFEMMRVLDDAKIEIADGQWKGVPCHVATITLPPRSAYLGCGVMLGFTSWSYVHHLYPAYEVVYIDKQRLVPLHETLIASRGDRRFEIDFSNYELIKANGQESLVPLHIELSSEDYFTCRYEFQIVDGRQWLLGTVESWFKPDEKSRGTVEDVRVDQPSPLAEDVVRQLQAYRDLFEHEANKASALEAPTQTVDAFPFTLGQPRAIGPAELVFTLDAQEDLILRCTTDQGDATVDQQIVVLLLDDADRVLHASQGVFAANGDGQLVATTSFGQSQALGATARFIVVGLGDVSGIDGNQIRQLRVWRPSNTEESAPHLGIADTSGQTRLIDVTLQQDAEGQSTAALHFASRDSMNEFQLDAAVAVFDKRGRLLAATTKAGSVRVDSEIIDEMWNVDLPRTAVIDEVASIAVGLCRGQTLSAPVGSAWGMFLDRTSPFSIDAMMSAVDPGCWTAALRQIERANDEALEHGLLGSEHRWRDQIASRETPADLLRPRVGRLLEILDLVRNSSTLTVALRLLGYSGDDRAVAPAMRLLTHDDPSVQDAAAIALGLLGREEALSRLDAILERSEPTNERRDQGIHDKVRRDALIALATVRSDASVPLVEKWMRGYVDGIEIGNATQGSSRSGTAYQADQLALLLGRLEDPRYVGILTDAVDRVESRAELGAHADGGEWLASIVRAGDSARDVIAPRIQRGDSSTLYALQDSSDAYYVEAVRHMQDAGVDADGWYWAVGYLWNIGTPEALDVLRKAYDRGIPAGDEGEPTRLRMATALAAQGDQRGFPAALAVLVELAVPSDPPDDEKARRRWEREIDRRRGNALDVFDRAGSSAVTALLAQHAADADLAEREALLLIVDELGSLPDSIRPQVEQWVADPSSKAVANHAAQVLAGE